MRWFVYKDQKVYGPYTAEQLSEFLGEETLVTREGHEEWMPARRDAALRDVLDGKIAPALEWYVNRRGHRLIGPMTRAALLSMIDRDEIATSDLVRHESWTSEVFLGQSRLYALWKNPSLDLGAVPAAELRAAPRVPAFVMPAPPVAWKERARRVLGAMPRGGWWILLGALLLLLATRRLVSG